MRAENTGAIVARDGRFAGSYPGARRAWPHRRKRDDYLKRPDLGRMLDEDSQRRLPSYTDGSCQLVIVIGDGLSPAAVQAHAVQLVRRLIPQLAVDGIEIGHA